MNGHTVTAYKDTDGALKASIKAAADAEGKTLGSFTSELLQLGLIVYSRGEKARGSILQKGQ